MKIAYITLTNDGYVELTKNCIESMKRCNLNDFLDVYCIDKGAYDKLGDYPKKHLLDIPTDDVESGFQKWREGNWYKVVYQKFRCIYKALCENDYVYYTDGDIIYCSDRFINDMKNRIDDNDLLIQNDKQNDNDDSELCSGIMYIKSNDKTREFFNPANIDFETFKSDQIYINKMKTTLTYERLPLKKYPNGLYHREKNPNMPYIIHYNYLIGEQKKDMMMFHSNWFL